MRNKNQSSAAPSMTSGLRSNEPSTAGGRELRLKARPPARFNSLRSERTVNQKQEPLGNTLLAQRYTLSGNSYFWRATADESLPDFPSSMFLSSLPRCESLVGGVGGGVLRKKCAAGK